MFNRFINRARMSALDKANQSAKWATVAKDSVGRFLTTAHHTLMVLGLTAITALGVMFFKPDIADQLKLLSPFSVAASEQSAAVQEADAVTAAVALGKSPAMDMPGTPIQQSNADKALLKSLVKVNLADATREQQRVTSWISKRYRVAGDATNMLVSATYSTAKELSLDPLLILAVMAIESGFNPYAESAMGAQGLMQVMSKVHHEKFQDLGGVKAALNPVANIRVGSLILKDYVTRNGSVEGGLKQYVGAAAFETDSGYGSKVMAEYRRLKEVAAGKNVPPIVSRTTVTATQAPAQPAEHAVERKPNAPVDAESAQLRPPLVVDSKANKYAAL
ncbi:hypothetical protein BH11PSE11_BH11PSE11_12870 [soil metagenome]